MAKKRCPGKVETYSRVCGYFSPVQGWNPGKVQELKDRRDYDLNKALGEEPTEEESDEGEE